MRSEEYYLRNEGGNFRSDFNFVYGKNNHGDHGDHGDKSGKAITFHFLFPVIPVIPVVVSVYAIANRSRSAGPRCAAKASPSSTDFYDSRELIFSQSRSNFLPAKWSEPR